MPRNFDTRSFIFHQLFGNKFRRFLGLRNVTAAQYCNAVLRNTTTPGFNALQPLGKTLTSEGRLLLAQWRPSAQGVATIAIDANFFLLSMSNKNQIAGHARPALYSLCHRNVLRALYFDSFSDPN